MTSDLVKRLREQYAGVASVVPEVGQLLDRIEALEREREWRPIEDALKDGSCVLVVTELGLVRVAFFDTARGGIWSLWPGREPAEPTHWMPLTTPPSKP